MSFSIQGLRVFLSIMKHGSLSAAGRELGMTQPAVSNHLHALEEKFGVCLLTRGRPLKATLAGQCLAKHARKVLRDLSRLESEMARHAGPCGRLVVGASSTPAELLMPKLAVEFAKRYPDVALDVRVDDTEGVISALLEREIEAGVVGHEVEEPRLHGRIIEQDELVVVVSDTDELADTKVSSRDLAGRAFVLREKGSGTRQAVEEGLAAAHVRPRIAMELGSNAAVAGAVAAGAGLGVVPARTVRGLSHIKPLRVRGLAFRRPFVLVTEKGRQLSPAAQAFVERCIGNVDA